MYLEYNLMILAIDIISSFVCPKIFYFHLISRILDVAHLELPKHDTKAFSCLAKALLNGLFIAKLRIPERSELLAKSENSQRY